MMNHGWVTPNADGSVARCGGPKICSKCAIEFAQKHITEKEKVIIAVALPSHTGQPLGGFTYAGVLPDKKFIRENGPSTAYSNGEEDAGSPDPEAPPKS